MTMLGSSIDTLGGIVTVVVVVVFVDSVVVVAAKAVGVSQSGRVNVVVIPSVMDTTVY